MVAMREILELGRRIGQEFSPRRVILFGSHARGEAAADSDVDLLVELQFRGNAVEKAAEISARVHPEVFPVDIIARTPTAIARRIRMGDDFMKSILSEGKTIYEDPDERVAFRYPGASATGDTAVNAKKICGDLRSAARKALGLPK